MFSARAGDIAIVALIAMAPKYRSDREQLACVDIQVSITAIQETTVAVSSYDWK
jgi:hypothetical protein